MNDTDEKKKELLVSNNMKVDEYKFNKKLKIYFFPLLCIVLILIGLDMSTFTSKTLVNDSELVTKKNINTEQESQQMLNVNKLIHKSPEEIYEILGNSKGEIDPDETMHIVGKKSVLDTKQYYIKTFPLVYYDPMNDGKSIRIDLNTNSEQFHHIAFPDQTKNILLGLLGIEKSSTPSKSTETEIIWVNPVQGVESIVAYPDEAIPYRLGTVEIYFEGYKNIP